MPNKITNPLRFDPGNLQTPFGIFEMAIRQYLGVHMATVQPVSVTSVRNGGQFVSVKPLLTRYDTGGREIPITDADIIPNVPVVQPFGKNGHLQIAPSVGDQGIIIACAYDVSQYKQAHNQTPVGSNRQFSWSDGFFLPLDFQPTGDGVAIQNGNSKIDLSPDTISMSSAQVDIQADTTITGNVDLGGTGGMPVARTGDQIQIIFPTPPVPNVPYVGTITGGSATVKAA